MDVRTAFAYSVAVELGESNLKGSVCLLKGYQLARGGPTTSQNFLLWVDASEEQP